MVTQWFSDYDLHKPNDHDRKNKGDRIINYKGHNLSIEVKSLQSNSVVQTAAGYQGTFQCDASDSRDVTFPDGTKLKTVCLLVGGFDLLAINLFEFGYQWRFAFVKNADLPRSTFRKYTPYQQQYLLQTTPRIAWPLPPPFRDEPFGLLDELVAARQSKSH